MCGYHIAPTPKYRRKIVCNQYRDFLGGAASAGVAVARGVETMEGRFVSDHVYMSARKPPKLAVATFTIDVALVC